MSHSSSWPCPPKRDLSELVCLRLWGVEEVTELIYVPKVKGLFSVSGSSRTFCQSEWIEEMWSINTMEYYSAMKKNEITPFAATQMGPEKILLSEERQIEKDASYAVTHQWNPIFKRIQRNLFTKQKRLTENKFMAPKGKMQGGWDKSGASVTEIRR